MRKLNSNFLPSFIIIFIVVSPPFGGELPRQDGPRSTFQGKTGADLGLDTPTRIVSCRAAAMPLAVAFDAKVIATTHQVASSLQKRHSITARLRR